MSDKESVEEKVAPAENDEVVEDDKADSKGQKRKKPAKAAEPSKKKSKVEGEAAAAVTENDKDSQNDTEEDEKPAVPLLDRSPEVKGTRVRKQVERLTMNSPAVDESPDRRKNEMLPGRGAKLSTSPRIMAHLQSGKHSELTLLHRLLYKRVGKAHEIKRNIREFSGFPFTKEDKEFESRKHTLEKAILNDLKHVCLVLDLERSGTKENIVERILDFLLCPDPSTKPVPTKKAKKSKKTSKDKEKKKKSPSKATGSAKKSSPKKNVTSNETVDDSSSSSSSDSSSSSEDEEPEKESDKKKTPPAVKKEKKPVAVASPKASKENPSASSKSDKKKASPKKSPKKAEIKIKLPAVNKAKKKLESDSEDNKKKEMAAKEEKEKSPPKKSDEPTDAELIKTIKAILKDANLEDMTMKNLCLKVYEKYPKCDLEKTKKDFIRSTAKEIIGSGD